jgi:hypothetical protein
LYSSTHVEKAWDMMSILTRLSCISFAQDILAWCNWLILQVLEADVSINFNFFSWAWLWLMRAWRPSLQLLVCHCY